MNPDKLATRIPVLEFLALPFLPVLVLGALATLFLVFVWAGIVNVVRH